MSNIIKMVIIIFSSSFSAILKLLVSLSFHEREACNIFEKNLLVYFWLCWCFKTKSLFQIILQATRSCQLHQLILYEGFHISIKNMWENSYTTISLWPPTNSGAKISTLFTGFRICKNTRTFFWRLGSHNPVCLKKAKLI